MTLHTPPSSLGATPLPDDEHAQFLLDAGGDVVSWSQGAARLTGWSAEDVTGRPAALLYRSRDQALPQAELRLAVEESPLHAESWRVRSDGTEFLADVTIMALRDERGALSGFREILFDITDRKAAELLHASRLSAMSTMASMMAHELNQPLTAIANYMEAARDLIGTAGPDVDDLVRQAMDESAKQALRAGEIVRRMRDLVGRADRGRDLEDVSRLIEDTVQIALVHAAKRRITVTLDLDRAVPPVRIDRVQMQQVLVNLIDNAVRALSNSAERAIKITTKSERNGVIRVSVADNGSGIDPALDSDLFRAFAVGDGSGHGLGLSICRTIVEAHGGRIWAEPREGGGTVFHFTLLTADARS